MPSEPRKIRDVRERASKPGSHVRPSRSTLPSFENVTPAEAIAVQRQLASRVIRRGATANHRWIAGLDAAFSPDGRQCVGAVVLWDRESRDIVEQHVAWLPVRFPYIPGLLSFREAPALLAALRTLDRTPDVLLCDGHGLAHPRRFGLACHLGVLSGLPAIGCAKSRLLGTHGRLAAAKGSQTRLLDGEEVIGAVVRTRSRVRPVYVSVGHRVDLEGAVAVVLNCAPRYRVPEPTRRADQLTKIERQRGVTGSAEGG